MTALPKLIEAAPAAGFTVERPTIVDDKGRRSLNPRALRLPDGGTYTTLCIGPVRVALSNIGLYYHDGRVWLGDCSENHPTRVTIAAIVVEPESRQQGEATRAMERLTSLCDSLGLWLQLEASPMPSHKAAGHRLISQRRLSQWYSKLGFTGTGRIMERRHADPVPIKKAR